MPYKIGITTTSFGEFTSEPLAELRKSGIPYHCNALGRPLKREEIGDFLKDCQGVIAGTEIYDEAVLKRVPQLKIISRCGAGIDNIDMNVAAHYGIRVYSTPEAPVRAVAEFVIGLAFNLLRNISLADRNLRKNIWQKKMGNLFFEKEIGIIGLGRIGQAVAQLCLNLGARVFFYDPFVNQVSIAGVRPLELKELLKRADIVTVHVPLTAPTRNLVGSSELGLMKKGAFLINCSRGGVVDEKALSHALKEKKLAGAAVDVFEDEPYRGALQELDNVILTPHIGSYAQEARVQMEIEAVRNLMSGLTQIKNEQGDSP